MFFFICRKQCKVMGWKKPSASEMTSKADISDLHPGPRVAWHSSQYSHPLPHTIMVAVLSHQVVQPSPECAPTVQQQPNISALLTLSELKLGHR